MRPTSASGSCRSSASTGASSTPRSPTSRTWVGSTPGRSPPACSSRISWPGRRSAISISVGRWSPRPMTHGGRPARPRSERVFSRHSLRSSNHRRPDSRPSPGGTRPMTEAIAVQPEHTALGRLLDIIERNGNRVPHPVMMFLYLMIGVIVLSAILAFLGVSVTDQIAVPDAAPTVPNYYEDSTQPILIPGTPEYAYQDGWHLEEVTIPVQSLLSVEGIRFIFTSFVPNFAGFGVIAVTFVALMGAGVAEAAGLMGALIRLLVGASPRRLLAFVLIFVGVLSSVASDAGYLILVPLGAARFLSVGRNAV